MSTVTVVPVAGVLGTVAAYKAFGTTEYYFAILIGVLIALVAWLVATLFYGTSATAKHANPANYNLICEELDQLMNRKEYGCPGHSKPCPSESEVDEPMRKEACEQAQTHFKHIQESLDPEKKAENKDLPWSTGDAYIDLWHRIHRAEEALIMVVYPKEVLQGAKRDELRLKDSNIANKDTLLKELTEAVNMLNAHSASDELKDCAEARTTLRGIRYQINSFRDDAWAGMIRARNRLLLASLCLGFAAYVLLMLAIMGGADPEQIFWAGIYFIVGASIGLFARVRAEAAVDTATDDFGLSTARLIHIPIFSGMAAVLGVVLLEVLDKKLMGGGPDPNLVTIFNGDPKFLVAAAVFGLVPDLVIQSLGQQAERYREDLKSTRSNRQQKRE
jgi:hypothetical protein